METSDTGDLTNSEAEEEEPNKLRQKRVFTTSSDENDVDSDETNASIEPLQPIRPDGFMKNLQKMAKKSRRNVSKRWMQNVLEMINNK